MHSNPLRDCSGDSLGRWQALQDRSDSPKNQIHPRSCLSGADAILSILILHLNIFKKGEELMFQSWIILAGVRCWLNASNLLQRPNELKTWPTSIYSIWGKCFLILIPWPYPQKTEKCNILQATYNILPFSGVSLGDVGRRFFWRKRYPIEFQQVMGILSVSWNVAWSLL